MKVLDSDRLDNLSSVEQHMAYNGLDGALTMEIFGKIPQSPTYEVERSMLPMVIDMMARGILIDEQARAKASEELGARLGRVSEGFDYFCQAIFGRTYNPRSYLQMQELLYQDLLLPEVIVSKKGAAKVSTDRDTLEKLYNGYVRARPFLSHLLRMRDLEKTLDTLGKKLRAGRWHASFNIGGTDTGRWSSSSHPFGIGSNLQNIDDWIRRIFIPDPGHVFFNCDQQGAEARVVGYIAGDEAYIKAIESGDVHTMVASMVFGFEPRRELADRKYYRDMSYRDIAKRCAHGSNYGGSPYTIARVLKVETKLVEDFQTKYFKAFPHIRKWQMWVAREIQSRRRLVTPLGRVRNFWDNPREDASIRAAIAFVPQSTVGDLTSRGLLDIWTNEPDVQILNNIHDAAFGQIPIGREQELLPRILKWLTRPVDVVDIWGVRRQMIIPWEAQTGYNWGKRRADNPRGLKDWP